jgi:ketosteroid isomerase-like protein
MTIATDLRSAREQAVETHMAEENVQHWDRVLETFAHPRYEIIPSGRVFDGHEEVMKYFHSSRQRVPDQRNEIISLRHADDAVVVESWLMGSKNGKAGGPQFRCRMAAFFIFEGAKIVCERVYFDRQTLQDG